MTCEGLPAVTYDLYVLGLLDEQEQKKVSSHIEDQCLLCIQGVQRSMNLWIVFASTLQNAEPSAGFRERLMQIADLSKRVLTFPTGPVTTERSKTFRWMLACLGFCLAALLILGGWRAGRASASIEQQRLTNDLGEMTQRLTTLEVRLHQESMERKRTESLLTSSSNRSAVDELSAIQDALVKSQAEANQYKSLLERDRQNSAQNKQLLSALSMPRAHFFPLKGMETATLSVAYVIVIPNTKLIFIGSNLPKPKPGRAYQIWVERKQDPKMASAAVFSPDASAAAFLQVEDPSVSGEFSAVTVTEEPRGGSEAPSGPKLFVGNAASGAAS